MIKKYKNGFTFAELMISLVVIAVITVILMPIVANLNPNYNKQLFKSTYRTIEMTVADIVESPNFYALGDSSCVAGVANVDRTLPATAQGLCTEFWCRLNVQGVATAGGRVAWTDCTAADNPGFISNNGVRWRFRYAGNQHFILIDVNPNNNTVANVLNDNCFTDNYGMGGTANGFMCNNDAVLNDTFEVTLTSGGRIEGISPAVGRNHLDGTSAD